MHVRIRVAALVLFLATPASAQVRVEDVTMPGAGGGAVLRRGDVLLRWERLHGARVVAGGAFKTPFDARDFELEQLPRGHTRITLVRDGQRATVALDRGPWGVRVGLDLPGALGTEYRAGLELARNKHLDPAGATWWCLADALVANGRMVEAAWLYTRIGTLFMHPIATGFYPSYRSEGDHVHDAIYRGFDLAKQIAWQLGDRHLEAHVYESAGAAWETDVLEPFRAPGDGLVRNEFAFALALREAAVPNSLTVAASLHALAAAWAWRDDPKHPPDPERATALYLRAIELRAKLAPSSYEEAVSRLYLGLHLFRTGSSGQAYRELSRAAQILTDRAPLSREFELAAMVGSLAAGDEGDYLEASRLYRAGLAVARRHQAFELRDLQSVASFVALVAGRFGEADRALRRHLATSGVPPTFLRRPPSAEGSAPGDLDALTALDFGRFAADLGNTRSAAAFLRFAVESAGALPPSYPAEERRDIICAATARLVAIGQESTVDVATLKADCKGWGETTIDRDPYGEHILLMSRAALARGDLSGAMTLASTAARARRRGGTPAWIAEALTIEGSASCRSGATDKGLAELEEANRRYGPLDRRRITTLEELGNCARQAGKLVEGARYLQSAIALGDALDDRRQRGHASADADPAFDRSDQWRSYGTASLASAQQQLTEVLARLGRAPDAFEAVERGRARSFRKVMAERLEPVDNKDEWLLGQVNALLEERARVWQAYNDAQGQVEATSNVSSLERARRVARLHALGLQLAGVEVTVRNKIPRSTYRVLDAGTDSARPEDISAALDEGTLFVEYLVGPAATEIFLLHRGSTLSSKTVPVGAVELDTLVTSYLDAIQRPDVTDATEAAGRRLYALLLAPIESEVDASDCLVLVPDGPLHTVPFGALRRTSTARPSYLAEWKPVHVAPSATAYLLLRRLPLASRNGPVVAMGDPRGTGADGPASTRADETEGGGDPIEAAIPERGSAAWQALPGSRREVFSVARIMGPGVMALVGNEASEARLKALPSTTRILHLATHGVLNTALPANSGLITTAPRAQASSDNGRLQVWEITDQLHLRADLVTLSACESAGGRLFPGEGVMSLARAFHIAGARSVVSTLWRIDDNASEELMTTFYEGLKRGLAKDEALRQAQLRFIRGDIPNPLWRSPKFWAAFILSGDWRPLVGR